MGLSNDQIAALYAKRRVKGLYEDKLMELMESDEPAIDPADSWPVEFSNKSATTMYQGFNNAAKKLNLADDVDVIQRDGAVFIAVKTRIAHILNPTSEDEDTDVEIPVTTMNGDNPNK